MSTTATLPTTTYKASDIWLAKESLSFSHQELGFVTSEKQAPSCLDMLGAISEAVNLERRAAQGKANVSKALKDLMGKAISSYNTMVTVKKHRIDTKLKSMIYNLLLGFSL